MKGTVRLRIDGKDIDVVQYHSKAVLRSILELFDGMRMESDRQCMKDGTKPVKHEAIVRPDTTDEPYIEPPQETVSKKRQLKAQPDNWQRPKAEYSNKGYQSLIDKYA